jgi:uncharacterized protein
MAILEPHRRAVEPLVLTVPGLFGSGPNHWQSIWERERRDCRRVELGMWENPHRNTWVNQLNLAIERADRPVVLAAHSLGCLAVAWWARYEQPRSADPVIGALLVAPPEVEQSPIDPRLANFAPFPEEPLPFPTIFVASRNDPFMAFQRSVRLARDWGSWLVDAGHAGHLNAESGLGDWSFGQTLLGSLMKRGLALQHQENCLAPPVQAPQRRESAASD